MTVGVNPFHFFLQLRDPLSNSDAGLFPSGGRGASLWSSARVSPDLGLPPRLGGHVTTERLFPVGSSGAQTWPYSPTDAHPPASRPSSHAHSHRRSVASIGWVQESPAGEVETGPTLRTGPRGHES